MKNFKSFLCVKVLTAQPMFFLTPSHPHAAEQPRIAKPFCSHAIFSVVFIYEFQLLKSSQNLNGGDFLFCFGVLW